MDFPSFLDLPSFLETFTGFFFNEAGTLKGECNEIVEWKTVLEKIIGELMKEPQMKEKLENMMKSTCGDFPFLCYLFSNSIIKKILSEYVAQCKQQIKVEPSGKKNATKAASIRLQGNSLFAKKEYGLAFKTYTRGLMFVRDADEETPLLYANRSAAYFYLKQFENTLEDIERAFKFGYGKIKPTGKLFIRKGFSLLALGRDDQAKELLDKNMPANENAPDFAQWQQLKKQTENVNRQITKRDIAMSQFQDVSTIRTALTNNDVFRPHERYPWLNAKIDLHYDAGKGYHLVSKEEMKYGEIVALSKPFVCLDLDRDSYERCHYCMVPCFETAKYFSDDPLTVKLTAMIVSEEDSKLSLDSLRMATPLACPECSNVLYCSEACRTAAWTAYHRFECSQMTILSKIDGKTHLALRMLYMMGSLEKNSPAYQIGEKLKTTADPCALMIDQQAYSFVYSNQAPMGTTFDMNLERTLTICFLLKLAQMSDLLIYPKNISDREFIDQAAKVSSLLLRHLCQGDVNETMPFTYQTTGQTVTPSPVLSVDGMTALMKHSCEATVATSSLLSESFESNVKLLHATGAIPAGTVLTLAYHTEDNGAVELLYSRKWQLCLWYKLDCTCTRCVREERDCLDISTGVYYPITCSLCGSLMVRAAGEEGDSSSVLGDSYRCSSSDGCNFKYSAQEMKNVYERIGKMMELKRGLSFLNSPFVAKRAFVHSTSGIDLYKYPYSSFQPKIAQLKAAIESTVHLLYGRSEFLARLYAFLAHGYLLISMAPISEHYSGPVLTRITSSTHRIHTTHLTTALLYTDKALDVLESMKKGPCAKSKISGLLVGLSSFVDVAMPQLFFENEPLLRELHPQMEKAKDRYEALLKMTAYDTMVASSLAATIQE